MLESVYLVDPGKVPLMLWFVFSPKSFDTYLREMYRLALAKVKCLSESKQAHTLWILNRRDVITLKDST